MHTSLIWFEIETYGEPRSHVSRCSFYTMWQSYVFIDETLACFIKQNT